MKMSTVSGLFRMAVSLAAVLLMSCSANNPPIQVVTKDFSVSIDPSQIEAGSVTFEVQNEGSVPHDFAIQTDNLELKTAMIAPGESDTLTVELDPGTYTYTCTVPGHEQLGMRGTITVISR